MKIQRVEIYPLVAKLEAPFGWSQRWTDERAMTAVKILTDDGTYGWGESWGGATMGHLAALLIGEDPERHEALWQKLHRASYQGHGFAGGAMGAISALDMALWDIAGKAAGKPVSELLGGGLHDRIAVYATGLYYVQDDYPDTMAAEAAGYVEQGFTGMKMKIGGKPVSDDIKRVYHIRETIGRDVQLMVDANEAYNVATAVRVSCELADARLAWFEEPCGSYDDEANLRVRNEGAIPISGGESLKSRYEFADRFARRVFDIVQPDIVSVGGISEMFKVAHMANAYGIQFNPHFWGTGISLAATLHVAATFPLNPPSACPEPYVNQTVVELDRTPHPIRESLTYPIFEQHDSHIAVPTSPGLGVEVHGDVLQQFLVGQATVVTQPDGE
jgi:D-galactarolactone cycloisomerase